MNGLRSIRPLGRESLRGVEPSRVDPVRPKFEWVDPKDLYVEEGYQREVTENGRGLVRKIYNQFSWARFKPPVCVRLPESGNVLVCVDGQHTATAAASHPGIDKIPVMIVPAAALSDRASSFVGHNLDRLALTAPAIFRAELAAGEPIAIAVARACRAAGVTVLPTAVNLRDAQPVGSTIAIGTIKIVMKKHGEAFLARVLKVLVSAERGPIKAAEVAAVASILACLESDIVDARLARTVGAKTAEQWAALASQQTAESGESLPSALASLWCRTLDVHLGSKLKPVADVPAVGIKIRKQRREIGHAPAPIAVKVTPPTPRPPAPAASAPPSSRPPPPILDDDDPVFDHGSFPAQRPREHAAPSKADLRRMLAEAAANTAKMKLPE